MALLSNQGAPIGAQGVGPVAGAEAEAAKTEGKGKSYDYQRKQREKMRLGALRILENKAYPLTAQDKAFLEHLARPVGTRSAGSSQFGTPILTKLFGTTPAVGQSVTLHDVFEKTYKGKAQMDAISKKWKEKHGIVVEFALNKDKPTDSTYTIVAIP